MTFRKQIKIFLTLLLIFTFNNGFSQDKDFNKFHLPKTNFLKYVSIGTELERIFPFKECEDSILKQVKFYNKKLPDIEKYSVYYSQLNCSNFSATNCICDGSNQLTLGLLFLHNKVSKVLTVCVVSFDFLYDSEVFTMSYKINSKEIRLIEKGFTEGDGGKAEIFQTQIHKIKILKNGKLQITTKK